MEIVLKMKELHTIALQKFVKIICKKLIGSYLYSIKIKEPYVLKSEATSLLPPPPFKFPSMT